MKKERFRSEAFFLFEWKLLTGGFIDMEIKESGS